MRNITFKAEKIMATTSLKCKESYKTSFHNCKSLHFEKEKSVNHVRMTVYLTITLTHAM